MLSISNANGWLSNTISQAQIINIASAAQKTVDGPVMNPVCETATFEKLMDYVFCGSVKQEYMHYLYAMSRNRALWEKELRKSEQTRSTVKMDMFVLQINENMAEIQRLMSGNSLEFGTRPTDNMALSENYLIYKEKLSDKLIGLPLEVDAAAPQPTSESHLDLPIPNFPGSKSIRFEDYGAIKRSRQFICQGRTYLVRFTDKNEPVVMQLGVAHQDARIQKILTNFWAIELVKNKLTVLRNSLRQNSTLRLMPDHFEDYFLPPRDSDQPKSAVQTWAPFATAIQARFDQVVSRSCDRLDVAGKKIRDELSFYENLDDPVLLERSAFIATQQEMISWRESQRNVSAGILQIKRCIERTLGSLFDSNEFVHDPEVMNLVSERIQNFIDRTFVFLKLRMTNEDSAGLIALCNKQLR